MSKRVLFVGSFESKTKTGGFGGQMYACNSLVNSSLSDDIQWTKIDTTAETNMKVSVYKKLIKAFKRLSKFLFLIIFKKHTHVFIFSSNGLSFKEKGLMAILASKLTKAKVIFAPRSGRLKDEIYTSKVKFMKRVFRNVDLIICQGESWKLLFSTEVCSDDNKYVVQKNWVDYHSYNVNPNKNEKEVTILFLGWLVKDKGILDLVSAAENFMKKKILNVRFVIAGKGQDEELFKEEISKRNLNQFFHFEGWVGTEKKKRLFDKSHIFVLPSYYEGMPNALLESMASGIASIASNVGSIPDVLNKNNGIMFDRKEGQQFVDQLEALVLDKELQRTLGNNARAYIINEHSIQSAVANFKNNIFN